MTLEVWLESGGDGSDRGLGVTESGEKRTSSA